MATNGDRIEFISGGRILEGRVCAESDELHVMTSDGNAYVQPGWGCGMYVGARPVLVEADRCFKNINVRLT